jgi:hypothetical protein
MAYYCCAGINCCRWKEEEEMNSHLAVVSLALQIPTMAIALGLPICRIITTGRFWSSFFRMWLYLFLWTVLFCMVIPIFIAGAFHVRHVFEYFPDGIGMGACFIIGWLPCIMLCSITWITR